MGPKDPSFAPSGVSPDGLRQERANFEGVILSGVGYGALLMLFVQLMQVMLTKPKRGKMFWPMMVYAFILFALSTISFAGTAKFTEMAYIDNGNFPGGAAAFTFAYYSDWVNVISSVCITLIPWFSDALMLYRLMVVWSYDWRILIFPGLVYLGRLSMSIPSLIEVSQPHPNVWTPEAVRYATACYSLSAGLNVIVTLLIAFRLFVLRKRVSMTLGRLQAGFYTSFVTILAESAALFSIWSLLFVAAVAQHSNVEFIFLGPFEQAQGITRFIILLRMAQGRAWSKDIVTAMERGVMDWKVSSANSIPLDQMSSGSGERTVGLHRTDWDKHNATTVTLSKDETV